MTWLELCDRTFQLSVKNRWRLLWVIVRSLLWPASLPQSTSSTTEIDQNPPKPPTDLSQYRGVLSLSEDPLIYQQRIRDEWTES
jgi:hypothetical protein